MICHCIIYNWERCKACMNLICNASVIFRNAVYLDVSLPGSSLTLFPFTGIDQG
jgi:hypothetical protein